MKQSVILTTLSLCTAITASERTPINTYDDYGSYELPKPSTAPTPRPTIPTFLETTPPPSSHLPDHVILNQE